MTKHIAFSVQCADIAQFEADVIALKYARGLFGAALAVARALGQTEALMQQRLPSVGSVYLFPGMGRIKARQALFIRVVQLSAFDYGEIRQFSYDFLKGLSTLLPEARHVAMTIHGTGFGLSTSKTVHAEIYGCIEAVRAGKYPSHLERISIVERDEALARQFQSELLELLPEQRIEVLSPDAPELQAEGPEHRPATPSAGEYDVFISYKSEDTAHAREVYEFLKAQGLRVFFSRESLPRLGSDEYHEQIDLAIERARHMVIVTTSGEHTMAKWVNYEWRLFLGEKLAGRKTGNLVSVIAGDMTIGDLPISLRNREVLQLTPADLGRLLEYVKSD
jgi:hypothetical protein